MHVTGYPVQHGVFLTLFIGEKFAVYLFFKFRENLNPNLVNSLLVTIQLKIYLKYEYFQRLTYLFKDLKKVADIICSNSVDKERYRIGNTKIFFRSGVLGYMEELRWFSVTRFDYNGA